MSVFNAAWSIINKNMYWLVPTSVTVTDIIEVIIISFMFYEFMAWIKRTRAWVLFKGIIIILIFVLIAALLQMTTIVWLASKLVNVGLIAVIVVFQPELRNALEHLGRKSIFRGLFNFSGSDSVMLKASKKTATEVAAAADAMGKTLTGALIVFEGVVPLDEYADTGIKLNSEISAELLINIFEHNTPLHDGAVIISEDRIVSATCYLPLSANGSISKSYGTRHRAAVGISEVSDSLTVIVSEETGRISVAREGELETGLTEQELKDIVFEFVSGSAGEDGAVNKIVRRFKRDEESSEADHE